MNGPGTSKSGVPGPVFPCVDKVRKLWITRGEGLGLFIKNALGLHKARCFSRLTHFINRHLVTYYYGFYLFKYLVLNTLYEENYV